VLYEFTIIIIYISLGGADSIFTIELPWLYYKKKKIQTHTLTLSHCRLSSPCIIYVPTMVTTRYTRHPHTDTNPSHCRSNVLSICVYRNNNTTVAIKIITINRVIKKMSPVNTDALTLRYTQYLYTRTMFVYVGHAVSRLSPRVRVQ